MTGEVTLIIASVTLTTSIIIILLSIILRFRYHKEIPLTYLGLGISILSIWNICSSYCALYLVVIAPIPFMLYINILQCKRYRKAYAILCFALVAEFLLLFILFPAKVLTLDKSYPYVYLIFSLSILLTIITFCIDIRKGFIKEYLRSAVIMVCIWLAGLSRLVFHNSLLPIGLVLFEILAVIDTLHELAEMENQRQRAIFANEAKGKFLANMSHEIRTPINAVLGMDTMILRETTEAKIKEYALDIQNAGQSLLALINDILDLSKIESGKLELLPHEYDLGRLLHDTVNMIDAKASSKGLTLNTEIDTTLPSKLHGDNTRIRQILINLLNNAVKYTEKGSVTMSVSGVKEQDVLHISFHVRDTGIGIKEEDMPKLFAEFERIEEERNRNIEGTGLGMSITIQLLNLMDSHLEVESVYGKGSDFFFTISQKILDESPVGDLSEQIKKQADDYAYQESFTAPDAHVLVTDDNAMNRKVFTSLLKTTGIQTEEAESGMECIEMTKQKHYDIIFLDHMMPDLDGIETLHRIMQDKDNPCHDSPFIALTANAIVGAKEMYLAEGFHDFLSKPIDPDELEKMIMEKLPEEKIQRTKQSASAQSKATQTELPEIPGIDWKVASLRLKNQELLLETVRDFYKTAGSEAEKLTAFWEQLTKGLENGDTTLASEAREQFGIRVHAMKSTAATIGALWLSGTAKLLEDAAKQENTDIILAVTPTFLEDWQHMTDELAPLFQEESTANIPITDENRQSVKDSLTELGNAMADMDVDTADEIIVRLKQYLFPDSLPALIEKLELAVANLDDEQTADIIKEILNHKVWR